MGAAKASWRDLAYEEEQRNILREISVGKLCAKCRGCGCKQCKNRGTISVKLGDFIGETNGSSVQV